MHAILTEKGIKSFKLDGVTLMERPSLIVKILELMLPLSSHYFNGQEVYDIRLP